MAIVSASGGVVLIDEVENGLHYSVQQKVWRAIAHAARQANVQVFATTHSWECLVKAHEAFAEDEVYDFRWHRLQLVDGRIEVVSHDREMIEAALYSGVEIR
jgi:AAA15 family ATPase/GTPase